jgi:hypothetical protein
MTRAFECAMCSPGCRLETDEDDVELPHAYPFPVGENAPKWQETDA